jgi:hypothetical protein
MSKTLVSKAKFARLRSCTPQAVNKWINTGKLSAAALVGGKIWVEQAEAELLVALDPQQPASSERDISVASAAALLRRRVADAGRAEEARIAAHRENAIHDGRWVEVAGIEKAYGKKFAEFLQAADYTIIERAAKEIAGEFGLDWRLVSVVLRRVWRQFRQEQSDKYAAAAE